MVKCVYLEGENIRPKTSDEARAMIGMHVQYLRRKDIDRSGRGYYFPQNGVIVHARGRNVAIDEKENFEIFLTELIEMVEYK